MCKTNVNILNVNCIYMCVETPQLPCTLAYAFLMLYCLISVYSSYSTSCSEAQCKYRKYKKIPYIFVNTEVYSVLFSVSLYEIILGSFRYYCCDSLLQALLHIHKCTS